MRSIFLPELVSINIKNYTLYPNGLDYTFDFVKGVNLILGGNGMGKTTFANIIKFSIIGLYKKHRDYTRTYKDKAIVKRLLYPSDFFSARKDKYIQISETSKVSICFKFKDTRFIVNRSLEDGILLSVQVGDKLLEGLLITEEKYEKLSEIEQPKYLLKNYEDAVLQYSKLSFDDLIFFVNEILFFGEDHKTVLWNDGFDGRYDVQNELFNKYFNEPDLDKRRQEAQRQARYYDSLARHKSEDMRVISNLISKIENKHDNKTNYNPHANVIELNEELITIKNQLDEIHKSRLSVYEEISKLQGDMNSDSIKVAEIDKQKSVLGKKLNTKLWEQLHPQYDIFVKNIQLNHVCPMCNQLDMDLVKKVEGNSTHCFLCNHEIHLTEDDDLCSKYKTITDLSKSVYQSIVNKQKRIKSLEYDLQQLDIKYKQTDLKYRSIQQLKREVEYKNSIQTQPQKLQTLYDEYNKYQIEKEHFQELSAKYLSIEKKLSKQIEGEILKNVSTFSAIFSSYANNFLGVECKLSYIKRDSDIRRFFPIIDGEVRYSEDSLSESQRFFIDHSFRMSILSFFYQSPAFYIVETPDSSLDISYEKNAADVFLRFLQQPNSIIITSNLNNSSFINHLIKHDNTKFAMVGLLDIAKKSTIQVANEKLKQIYNNIKQQI